MQHYDSFNGLRGYAAVGILLMHYLVNLDSEKILFLKNANSLLYGQIIVSFDTFVYLFFIVSAFSMCCGYFEKFRMESLQFEGKSKCLSVSKFDTNRFYSKRYSRIWPFFALLVCIDVMMKPSITELYQAFADLTLAFNLLPNPDINVVGVGWFLGLVFLFYMIFPWFCFLLTTKKRAWFVMAISLFFHVVLVRYFLTSEFCTASQLSNFRHNMVYSFPFFMVGGLLYLYREKLSFSQNWKKIILLFVAIVATILFFTPFALQPFGEKNLWVGVIFVLWVMYAVSGGISIKGFKLLDNRIATFLSGLSMEIYLCHMVMFRVIEKAHLDKYIGNVHLLYWTYCILGIGLAVLFSMVVTRILFPKCGKLVNQICKWMPF